MKKISVKMADRNGEFIDTKPSQPTMPEFVYESEVEKMTKPGSVVSQKDHNITISYNGESIIIPPRAGVGERRVANIDKLGALPRGVFVIQEPHLKSKN